MIMNELMEEVLEDPAKNSKEYLEARSKELATLSEADLKQLSQQGKEKTAELESEEIEQIKQKHFVK